MPRAKNVLVNLYSGCLIDENKTYIYNGKEDLPFYNIKIGDKVKAVRSWRSVYAVIRSVDGVKSVVVKRSDLQENIRVKPEKYLVTKNNKVHEIFACTPSEAKITARKLLGMQRLTGVVVTKIGTKSPYYPYKVGMKLRVTGNTTGLFRTLDGYHNFNIGQEVSIVNSYSANGKSILVTDGATTQYVQFEHFEVI